MLCISFLAVHVNLVAIIGIRNVIDKKLQLVVLDQQVVCSTTDEQYQSSSFSIFRVECKATEITICISSHLTNYFK